MDNLSALFARNLATAMADYASGKGISQLQLSKDSGVGQTTISLYLTPGRRSATEGKAAAGPTLERIGLLAKALRIEPWLLLHPDMHRARREREMYRRIEAEYTKLPTLPRKTPTS